MAYALYLESDAIQDWLMASNRLRDMVAGSDILASVWEELADTALRALGSDADDSRLRWGRRAGGALLVYSDDAHLLDRLQNLLGTALISYAPGLRFNFGRGQASDDKSAHQKAMEDLRARQNTPQARLPVAPPHATRDPRTGRPAIDVDREGVPLDAPTSCFSAHVQERRRRLYGELRHTGGYDPQGVAARFIPEGCTDQLYFPTELSPSDSQDRDEANKRERPTLIGRDEANMVAFVHGDGSGLGQLIQNFNEAVPADQYQSILNEFSKALDHATQDAARQATAKVLLPYARDGEVEGADVKVVPARPIVLGGDDLRIIMRADLAVDFVREFALKFQKSSRDALEQTRQRLPAGSPFPERLSIGFGIVYAKVSQPFARMAELADEIASAAKTLAKQADLDKPPSVLGFHRLTSSMFGEWEHLRDEQLLTTLETRKVLHTLSAYAIDPNDTAGLPSLDDLLEAQKLLGEKNAAATSLRQLLTTLNRDLAGARRQYERWHDFTRRSPEGKKFLKVFDEMIGKLIQIEKSDLDGYPAGRIRITASAENQPLVSPLGDLLALNAVAKPQFQNREGDAS